MKAIFFDIDGTLTDRASGKIVPSVYGTIQRLQQKGHLTGIVTGRALYKTRAVAKELGIDHIVSNGGAALAVHGQVVENRPLDREKALSICKNAMAAGYGLLIAFEDSPSVWMPDERFLEQCGERKEPTQYILKEDLDLEQVPAFYKLYLSIPQEDEPKLPWIHALPSLRFESEYLMYQYDEKDEGIRRMMRVLGRDTADVVVFGDDTNDLVMFRPEWFSVAMGNACQALKDRADFVTKRNVEDGIWYACEHFGWI